MGGNFADVPLSVWASWPEPNYADPERRTWMPAFSLVWQIVSTLLVFGRFFLRARKLAGPFGLDDLFIFVAWLLSVGLTTTAWVNTIHHGVDRHTWDVRPDLFPPAALTAWLAQVFFLTSSCATKISILLFYRRMAVDVERKWQFAIWGAMAFTALYCLGFFLAYCLICQPLEAYWRSYDYEWAASTPHHCADAGTHFNPAIGSFSVISDLYAVLLPCIMLSRYDLQINFRQKLALNAIFATGALVAGAGIARTYYLTEMGTNPDTSWIGFDLFIWSIVECQLGIICACAPSLRAFLRKYLVDALRSSRNRSKRATATLGSTTAGSGQWDGRKAQTSQGGGGGGAKAKRSSGLDERALTGGNASPAHSAVELHSSVYGWESARKAHGGPWAMMEQRSSRDGSYDDRDGFSDRAESLRRDEGDPGRRHDVNNAV
ncbi:hypothetical protein MBLNU230_g8164t1 [Neophaeotheca triangularis]